MDTSPITTWDGAAAYFTFADSKVAIAICLALAVGLSLTFFTRVMKHERESFDKHK